MAEGIQGRHGEIQALIEVHEEHTTAVEATLIVAGLRWRALEDPVSTGTDWGDVLAVLETAAWDSPIRRAVNPKDWPWGNPERDLHAGIVDELRFLRAQVGNLSGVKQHQLPTPIPRPHSGGAQTEVVDRQEATLDEIDRMLGW